MKKTITEQDLRKWGVCVDGFRWWKDNGSESACKTVFKKLIEAERFGDIRWLLKRLFETKEESVKVAIYAAELIIDIFEEKYPEDNRPRKAIEAATNWLDKPNKANETAAHAADAAADAADAAADAAHAATYAATYAARDAATSRKETYTKITNYAMEPLK